MQHGTLNLDTRENIFKLDATLRYLFDHGQWMLLPAMDIIDKYYNAIRGPEKAGKLGPEACRVTFPKICEGPYEYRILARDSMSKVPIHRKKPSEQRDYVEAEDYTFLDFPFDGQTFASHIHPRFVICNTGEKLALNSRDIERNYIENGRDILKLREVYRAWTSDVENTEVLVNFRDSVDPGSDVEGCRSSQKTKKGRLNARKPRPAPSKKRPVPSDESGSPTLQEGDGSSKKQRCQREYWGLDAYALYELDALGKGKEVMRWVDRVAESQAGGEGL